MKRTLAGRAVSPIGLGCMSLSHAYGNPPDAAQGARLLQRALDLGIDHFDTARLYGGGRNEELVGKAIGHRRDEYLLASKMGIIIDGDKRRIDCRPETIRAEIDKSLAALRTDRIDLYYLHRRDVSVPIEESVGALASLIAEGKIGGIGLSEMSARTLRAAHAEHPIAAMQTEYSPWTRNVEIAVLDTARELGVALVAFSPLARGALGGTLRDPAELPASDVRVTMPRFRAENWPINRALIDAFGALAGEKGVTPAQLALGWVLTRGDHVHAIPGTARIDHLEENVARAGWVPDADTVARIDGLINQSTVVGHRYPPALLASIDTEEFAEAE